MKRTTKILAGSGLAVVVAGGVAGAAIAQSGDDTPPDLDGAVAAASAEVADGTVTGVEQEDGGYDVELRRADGTEVDVRLDTNFAVVKTDTEDDDDGEGDPALDEATRTRAAEAAIASVGEGTVAGVESDDGGYDVDIRRADGTEVEVDLDANFAVVNSETDDDGDD